MTYVRLTQNYKLEFLFQLGIELPIGSCEYDGSQLLQILQICPDFCPEGQVSDLPLNPGTYGG